MDGSSSFGLSRTGLIHGRVRATMILLLRACDCGRSASRDRRFLLVCRAGGAKLRRRLTRIEPWTALTARITWGSGRKWLIGTEFARGIPGVDGAFDCALWHKNAP